MRSFDGGSAFAARWCGGGECSRAFTAIGRLRSPDHGRCTLLLRSDMHCSVDESLRNDELGHRCLSFK